MTAFAVSPMLKQVAQGKAALALPYWPVSLDWQILVCTQARPSLKQCSHAQPLDGGNIVVLTLSEGGGQ